METGFKSVCMCWRGGGGGGGSCGGGMPADKRGQMFWQGTAEQSLGKGKSTSAILRTGGFCIRHLGRDHIPGASFLEATDEKFAYASVLWMQHVNLINYEKPHWGSFYPVLGTLPTLFSVCTKSSKVGFIIPILQVSKFRQRELPLLV